MFYRSFIISNNSLILTDVKGYIENGTYWVDSEGQLHKGMTHAKILSELFPSMNVSNWTIDTIAPINLTGNIDLFELHHFMRHGWVRLYISPPLAFINVDNINKRKEKIEDIIFHLDPKEIDEVFINNYPRFDLSVFLESGENIVDYLGMREHNLKNNIQDLQQKGAKLNWYGFYKQAQYNLTERCYWMDDKGNLYGGPTHQAVLSRLWLQLHLIQYGISWQAINSRSRQKEVYEKLRKIGWIRIHIFNNGAYIDFGNVTNKTQKIEQILFSLDPQAMDYIQINNLPTLKLEDFLNSGESISAFLRS